MTPEQLGMRLADEDLEHFAAAAAAKRREALADDRIAPDDRVFLETYAARMERVAKSLKERTR